MMVSHAFVLHAEFEFKADLGLELFQIEIPSPHSIDIGQRVPNSPDWSFESALNDDRFRQIDFCTHNRFLSLCFRVRLNDSKDIASWISLNIVPNHLASDAISRFDFIFAVFILFLSVGLFLL